MMRAFLIALSPVNNSHLVVEDRSKLAQRKIAVIRASVKSYNSGT